MADTPIFSAYVTWLTQDGVWNPKDKSDFIYRMQQC